jgi:hypothetical protein
MWDVAVKLAIWQEHRKLCRECESGTECASGKALRIEAVHEALESGKEKLPDFIASLADEIVERRRAS